MYKVFINDGSKEIPEDDICYVVGKSGVFLKKKVGIIESVTPVNGISILKDVQLSAKINIPKIPGKDFARIINFFRQVYSMYKAESIILIFFNKDSKLYKFECPIQEVSAASLHYKIKNLRGFNLIGTIHCHGSMSAFHSGTDTHDEKDFDGIHITIGKISDNTIDISCSVVANGTRVINDPLKYIEGIELVENNIINEKSNIISKPKYVLNNSFDLITCDQKWFNNVKEKKLDVVNFSYAHMLDSYMFGGIDKYNIKNYTEKRNSIVSKAIQSKNIEEDDFNPCEECPFRNYKLKMLFEELEDDEEDLYDYDLPYIDEICNLGGKK